MNRLDYRIRKRKEKIMRKISLFLVALMLFISGCSVIMAGKKQVRKDTKVITIGNHRDNIVQTIGAPATSVKLENGGCKDVYKIVENAGTGGTKTLAIVGHAAMDVVTLGLWEIIGTPLELATQETPTHFILYYGPDYRLEHYEAIK